MTFIAATLVLAMAGGPRPAAAVTPIDAAAVAQWFCRCVDVKPYEVQSVELRPGLGYLNAPIYAVALKRANRWGPMLLTIDAVSGDVVFAIDGPNGKPDPNAPRSVAMPPPSPITDTWLKRLGRAGKLAHGAPGNRYDATVGGGYRFLNLNGSTRVIFGADKNVFVRYDGDFGALPPKPQGKAVISNAEAISKAIAERKKRVPNWPDPLRARTELGLFYDEDAARTIWVWKVVEGRNIQGKFYDSFINFVNAETGAIVPDQHIQNSRFMYVSRPPRAGLAGVKPLEVEIPQLELALKRLREIGRSDVRFDSFWVAPNVRLSAANNGMSLKLDSEGRLKEFKAPGTTGKLKAETALKKGRAIVRAQYLRLPEGRFVADGGWSRRNDVVVYRERALGYDYFNADLVNVRLGGAYEVVEYATLDPAPRPKSVPKPILATKQIDSMATTWAEARLPKDTGRVHNFVKVQVGRLGWLADRKAGVAKLVYVVRIMFMRDVKDWAVQGGGGDYYFDAVTGKELKRP